MNDLLMILMKTMIANEQPTISHEEALKSLETVHAFLLQ